MLSMHSEDTLVRQALAAGARGYILKNALDLDLAAAVKRVGGRRNRPRSGASTAAIAERRANARPDAARARSAAADLRRLSNREIADEARAQREHGRRHRANIMNALGVHKTAELVVYAIQQRPGHAAVNRRDFSAGRLARCLGAALASCAGVRARRPLARSAFTLVDVTAAAGHPVPAQQRRLRRQAAARDARLRLRVPRLRRRRLAGHPARQRHGLAGPQAAAVDAAAVPQQSQRHVHRRHAQRGPRRRDVRDGRRRRRLQQRRLSRHAHHVRRAEPPVPQHRQGHVRRRHAGERPRRPQRRSARRRCGSTSTATACSICSSATTCSGRRSTTSSAASTASRSRTARRKRIAATPAGCSAIAATARSKT